MSLLLPLLFSTWWAELDHPHRLFDQNFGVGLYPEQLMFPRGINHYLPSIADQAALNHYYTHFSEVLKHHHPGVASTISTDKDAFKVVLDVQQFQPEEITVKMVDRYVVVEAKHEEKKDEHGMVSRQFVRKYLLPDQVDTDKLSSSITSNGVLTIVAPLKQVEEKPNERTIKVEIIGKPAISIDPKVSIPDEVQTKDSKLEEVEAKESSKEEVTNQVLDIKPEK